MFLVWRDVHRGRVAHCMSRAISETLDLYRTALRISQWPGHLIFSLSPLELIVSMVCIAAGVSSGDADRALVAAEPDV